MEISRDNDYATWNLLDYEYFSKHFKLIRIELSMQKEVKYLNRTQQTNFIGNLERDGGETMFFVVEKCEEAVLNFKISKQC